MWKGFPSEWGDCLPCLDTCVWSSIVIQEEDFIDWLDLVPSGYPICTPHTHTSKQTRTCILTYTHTKEYTYTVHTSILMHKPNCTCTFYRYEDHSISFQTFFVWALLLIVHTWNSSPLRSNLLRLQCTCSIVPTTTGRPHGSPLVWACQWPSSQPLSSLQLSHNDSLRA